MPEIDVSESLYRKIEDCASEGDVEDALWEMVYLHQRGDDPV